MALGPFATPDFGPQRVVAAAASQEQQHVAPSSVGGFAQASGTEPLAGLVSEAIMWAYPVPGP